VAETQLDGRPVGIVATGGRFVVLQRPPGDAKHLEPGWWEAFDRDGHRVGSRHAAGFYPDDLAASADGHRLFILCSGRSEGDRKKPLGSLEALEVDPETGSSRPLGRITFDASDDPERLTISASARYAAVLLAKSRRTVAVDVSDPAEPRVIGRTDPVMAGVPYVSTPDDFDPDWIMMPLGMDSDTIALEAPGAAARGRASEYPRPDYLITTRDNDSALEVIQTKPQHPVGRFPLLGPFNLGRTRPTGLAYSPERNLIAVATRTGSIHVVSLRVR
jgi:glycerol-3-phosphate acyltransferase PlsY